MTVKTKPVKKADLRILQSLEKKVLWLSMWMVHNANHLRQSVDGLKVGGHQASSASITTIMTALYFNVLKVQDRVAVKPHASPVFHAIQYMLGRQTEDKLKAFRSLGGTQSYPSRTKDTDGVDFSTGSVGLGVAMTLFASMVQDYTRMNEVVNKQLANVNEPGRMIAVMGDAELDEGNIYEAMLEGWKYDVRNLWWIIDYNRQSLDGVVSDGLFRKIQDFFANVGWNVVPLKYGKKLEKVFALQGGDTLRQWIDDCPNDLYSALTFKGQSGEKDAWRSPLKKDLRGVHGIKSILEDHDDETLHALMTNLAGHDMEAVLEAFHSVADDTPQCFIAYTIKGHGTPLAGHRDNHAGLMNLEQMDVFRSKMQIPEGSEWSAYDNLLIEPETAKKFCLQAPFNKRPPQENEPPKITIPDNLPLNFRSSTSTQASFGNILNELSRGNTDLASRIVTTSPDVTVSTNLGPWVNQRGVFSLDVRNDVFRDEKVASAQKWLRHGTGQHFELGIAENNLFIMLAALGLSGPLFGTRLLPIGTLYDPFIARGLDSLNYACYQDARFMLVATPAGITLAPEGGAHQSISSPLIGIGQPGLSSYEPAYADELAVIMRWAFEYMQAEKGGSIYLRLSTRAIDQPSREMKPELENQIIKGAYWHIPPTDGARIAIVYSGAVVPEVIEAYEQLKEEIPELGIMAITSYDRLYHDWQRSQVENIEGRNNIDCHIINLLAPLHSNAILITVQDAHPATLSWLGSATGRKLLPLGVTEFGQSGNIRDLYRQYGIGADAIIDAAARASIKHSH